MSSLRNFLYRSPRFEAASRVDFISGNHIYLGFCHQISESGLRCTFSDAVNPGTEGLLTVYRDKTGFSAHAVILDIQGEEATAKFEFRSPQEKTAIGELLTMLNSDLGR